MCYILLIICLVLECSPHEDWNWNFGFFWILIGFLTLVQVALDVTKVTGRPDKEKGDKKRGKTS